MASDMLCYPGGASRCDYDGTGPGPDAAASAERTVRGRAGSSPATMRPVERAAAEPGDQLSERGALRD